MASLFKQITVLRKEGKLEEALALTNECFETYDHAEWTKKAAIWVYFELLKVAYAKRDFEKAKEWIACFDALELEDTGVAEKNFNIYRYKINGGTKMRDGKFVDDEDYITSLKEYEELAENGLSAEQQTEYGWTIYKFIKQQAKATAPNLDLVNRYLAIYTGFDTKEPSNLHSSILVFAIKFGRNRNVDVYGFLKNWNWKLIRKEDKERYVTPEGKTYDSTSEKALQTFVKLLLDKWDSPFIEDAEKELLEVEIFKFIDVLDRYIEEFPDNHWLIFGRVRLLTALGSEEDLSEDIFSLVRAKSNDYWIWDMLGSHHQKTGDNELAMSAYCKGLMCKTEPDLQTALREKLIEVLLLAELYNEAKTELDLILAVKNTGGYKISKKLTDWSESDWYKEARGSRHNYDLYKRSSPAAMSVLWSHLPSHVAVVVGLNDEKEIAQYIVSKELSGNFKFKQATFKSKVGLVVEVFLEEKTSPDGTVWYKTVHVQKSEKKPSKDIYKEIDDLAKVLHTGIGFTQTMGIFIPQQLVEEHKLVTGDILYGTAVISYNKKKDEWGWKMLSINE